MGSFEQEIGFVAHDGPDATVGNLSRPQVWFCDLDEHESEGALWSLLSPAERSRAARFRRDVDRRRFVARCAFVRRVLGSVVREPAESLVFRSGRCGKPHLSGAVGGEELAFRGLDFSLARSENVAGLAVASGRRVGIDLEIGRPLPDALTLAADQFGLESLDLLRSRPVHERDLWFYRVWTRKEALAKMQGRGIECRHSREPPTITHWTLRSFRFAREGNQVVGALAIEDARATTRSLSPSLSL